MKRLTEILTEIVSKAFSDLGYESSLGVVTVSDRMDLCQFQCNGSFAAAKLYKKAPIMIAQQLADLLSGNEMFSHAEAVKPGFLNLTLTDEYLLNYVNELSSDKYLGVPQSDEDETIIIDYGAPNVAKPLHIGHLRSTIIGESVKRIAAATGRKVYGDVHLGDWGTPMGLVIAEYRERHPEWRCFSEDFDPDKDTIHELDADELNEIYPFASAKSKTDEEFKEKAHKITFDFQNRKPGYYALGRALINATIADVKKSFAQLGANFDLWYGESDSAPYIPELFERLDQKGLLHESEGAMIVDVQEESDKITVPPVIVRKTDGSSTYATTDLATIIQRQRDFSPTRIWYVVDKRQSLHLTQVFRCARKAGLVSDSTELVHLGFGTMNGSDGKPFKTRDGGVMRLSELINTATQEALDKLESSEYVSGDKREVAQKIGVAAIKFGDLSNQPSKDYVFDISKFLSFDGKTGTYLLYTVTRINSILKKAGIEYDDDLKVSGLYSQTERELALMLAMSGEAYTKAFDELSPCILCDSAYGLASLFSRFYHDNRILSEDDPEKRSSWLALSLLTRKVITKLLDTLAIEYVENM